MRSVRVIKCADDVCLEIAQTNDSLEEIPDSTLLVFSPLRLEVIKSYRRNAAVRRESTVHQVIAIVVSKSRTRVSSTQRSSKHQEQRGKQRRQWHFHCATAKLRSHSEEGVQICKR